MSKRIQLITFLVFFLALCLPSIQQNTGFFKLPSINENRNRIGFPNGGRSSGFLLEHIYNLGVSYTSQYERAYNDNYGFRDFLILAKNQLDFSLFKHSDDIIIGSNGYLFFRDMLEKDLVQSERITDEQLNTIQENIVGFSELLQQKGIRLVVLLCRDKESIYADHILAPTARRPKKVRSESYVEFFAKQKNILFLDSLELLERAKKLTPVYYKTDFHWNTLGAYYMGRRLVNFLAAAEGLPSLWKKEPIIQETPNFSGTQNLYLATFAPATETAFEAKSTLGDRFKLLDQPLFPFEYYSISKLAKSNMLPKTVIIGNSFSPYFFSTDFPAFFKEVGYLFKGHLSFTSFENLIPEGTKYVVLQVNEFDLGTYYTTAVVWKFLEKWGLGGCLDLTCHERYPTGAKLLLLKNSIRQIGDSYTFKMFSYLMLNYSPSNQHK